MIIGNAIENKKINKINLSVDFVFRNVFTKCVAWRIFGKAQKKK